MFPIHVMPDLFGAPDLYSRLLYCSQVAHAGSLSPVADATREGVRYHVSLDGAQAGAPDPDLPLPDVATVQKLLRETNELKSTMSRDGLTPLGEVMIVELMRAGMLIDLTHMSLRARARVLEIAEKYRYPLMASRADRAGVTCGGGRRRCSGRRRGGTNRR